MKKHSDEKKHHERVEWPFASWIVSEAMVPWNLKEYGRILESYFPGDDGIRCKQILDCGCGVGVISVLLAKRGAFMKAVDISPKTVSIAKKLARENDLEGFIEVKEGILEDLPYPDVSFDIIVGTRILHHVEVEPSGHELVRVLKPGGRAIFWEPTYKNPFFRAMRKIYRTFPFMPRQGTAYEHSLTRREITILQEAFKGHLRMYPTPFIFYSHLVLVSNLIKYKPVREIASAIDYRMDSAFSFLRRWSYHQILVFTKE